VSGASYGWLRRGHRSLTGEGGSAAGLTELSLALRTELMAASVGDNSATQRGRRQNHR
jgi:hypothetical protein